MTKWGIKSKTCGVYEIRNKITGDFYIGSSCDIPMRLGTHFYRDIKLYPNKPLYRDILRYKISDFEIILLCECKREDLIKNEQYYYDLLKPTYNVVRPTTCNFIYNSVREKAIKMSKNPQNIEKRKKLYNTKKYKYLFQHVHTDKMKPVEMMLKDKVLKSFISLQEASRYISATTDYKGKNKTSKIKSVCDGERNSAYGFKWRYK